ncbi:M48 family metallopeptidase [Vibrio ulleungensis]|uniref:M48 family metalloprotease n=1 Tax=Vibrio ulleungensis TaxID=2807619 RepID=A0ABS2HKC4_9VIBR|nr:M48 family metallopeptidase [Vibrio ulleungensis]MBM7036982.1 M48 family metalloprotease [Vibrio ulleungensis]
MNRSSSLYSRSLALSAVIVALAGCSVSPEYDKEIGAKNSKVVEIQMGLYDLDTLQTYVSAVGQRLVSHLGEQPFEFEFHVVDDPMPNAFALPGGYIYITRGLLMLMNTEDELAGVLGHEISHVTQRHSVKQMQSSVVPGLLEVPGNIVGVVSSDLGDLINAPISTSNQLFLAGYSRSHETEADTLGATLAAKAGYKPAAMGDVLTRMNTSIEYITEESIEKSYFDSHPYTPERVENLNQMKGKLTITPSLPIDAAFPQPLDGMTVGENPDKGVFIEQQFIHPTLKFVIDFPDEWTTVNQPLSVGAFEDKQQGLVVLSGVGNKYDAKQNADRFKFAIEDRYNMEVKVTPTTLSDGKVGYLTTLKSDDEDTTNYFNQMWLDHNEGTYRVASLATESLQESVLDSMNSFRAISQQDYDKLTLKSLKVVDVEPSDSLEALNKQYSSHIDLALFKIINGIEEHSDTTKMPKVKVVVEQSYQ